MLTIDDPEIEQLARELADREGQSVQDVVRIALRAQAASVRPATAGEAPPHEQARRTAVLERIRQEMRSLPDLDFRSVDEIPGYGENGLPT
jgi:antitoxin VapB